MCAPENFTFLKNISFFFFFFFFFVSSTMAAGEQETPAQTSPGPTVADAPIANSAAAAVSDADLRLARLRGVFDTFDSNADGHVSVLEVADALRDAGVISRGGEAAMEALIRQRLDTIDTDRDGTLSFDEFALAFGSVADPSVASIGALLATAPDVGSDVVPVIPGGDGGSLQAMVHFLVAGATAGLASRALTAPLERAKILAMVDTRRPGEARVSLGARLARMGRAGPDALFKGLGPSLMRVVPFAAITCATYSTTLRWTRDLTTSDARPTEAREATRRFACASVAGMVSVLGTYPLSIAHTLIASSPQHHSVSGTLRHVVAQSGMAGLFRGVGPSLLVTMPFIGLQQSFYDFQKTAFMLAGFDPSIAMFGTSAVLAGVAAQTAVHPIDVVRVRMQASTTATGRSLRHTVRELAVAEGARGFYRGIFASLAKVAPSVGISLVVRDAMLGRV
jgi:solute carrier family 25 phosphate transporter 23/24/25/41